jgi:hypothetical protein
VAVDPLAAALQELEVARKLVARSSNRQTRNREHRDFLSATSFAWFESHRKHISTTDIGLLDKANAAYRVILDATAKNSAQSTYLEAMADAKNALIGLRSRLAVHGPTKPASDLAPDFSPLVGDATMHGILQRRWDECQKCLGVGADLAAIVMMGGLLEALFVAREQDDK